MIEFFNDWSIVIFFVVAVYEGLSRIIPTHKNYSVYDFVLLIFKEIGKQINKFFPNRKK